MLIATTRAAAQNAPSRPDAPGAPGAAPRWVDSIVAPFASPTSPGCAIGVTRNDSLTFAKGYGLADVAQGTPITPATRFYLASVSKQFTAMSIVLLAEDGKLSLDDSVQRWIPELEVDTPITLRQLLNHTSGLRDYFTLLALSGWRTDDPLTQAQFLDLIKRQKSLNFPPGDEFLYSNTGYALLAIVVERASGMSLRDFAAARIFEPLGMTHTEFRDDHRETIPSLAVGYEASGKGFTISQPEFDIVGDGGLYSTIEDLAKWDANFDSGVVGGRKGAALLEEPGTLNNGQLIPYGFGLEFGRLGGMTIFTHDGAYGGYRATFLRFPEKRLSVITLCNTSTAPPTLAAQVGLVMLGVVPTRAASATLDVSPAETMGRAAFTSPEGLDSRQRNDQLSRIAGEYYSTELDLAVTLVVRDGSLVLQRPNATDIRFGSFSNDLFTSSDKVLLRVERDADGGVTGFTLSINRVRDLEFVRREGT
jgi:CubicO group peptidase (beta-lactamase class C family)